MPGQRDMRAVGRTVFKQHRFWAEFDEFRTRFRALPLAGDARRWYRSIRRMRFPVSVRN